MRYYSTGPLIRVLRSSSSAFWWDAVVTARVSTAGIKRLSRWYKMFQAGLKSKPQGQVMSSIVSMDPNHGPLIQQNWRLFFFYLCTLLRHCERRWRSVLYGWGAVVMSDPTLPVTWPRPCCPCYRHGLKPGWRRFTANRWEGLKEDTSAGGKMHCIDQNGTYSPRQIQQQESVGVQVARLQRMYESFAKLQIQHIHFAVNFCSQLNIYDSHPLLCLRSSRPSFCSSVPCSLLLPVRPPFPHLLFLSHPPLPSFPVLLCPRPAPIEYHLTWHCVLGSIQWQRHIALLSLDTVSSPWNLCSPLSL